MYDVTAVCTIAIPIVYFLGKFMFLRVKKNYGHFLREIRTCIKLYILL